MSRRLLVALLLAAACVPLGRGAARAAEYTMETVARYAVVDGAAAIEVSVEAVFTNTLPDPPGQLSGFDRIDFAVHPGASDVRAQDATGPLGVEVEERDGFEVVSVKARARVRYNASVSFTLSYRLTDDAATGVHLRPQVVKFPVWGFGTSGEVAVELPAGYAVDIVGEPLTAAAEGGATRWASGPIADPSAWLTVVTASRPAEFATYSQSVALASGTADLQVRAWVGDEAWGERMLALLVRALPVLEAEIGLPYARFGPLVVTEAVFGEPASAAPASPSAEILVAFDEADFTVLHQAAHVWIGEQLAAERWIREGLASHVAARAAAGLDVPLPYAPADRAIELADHAFPLVEWGSEPSTHGADAYAYAASWAFVDRIGTTVGEAHLFQAIGRIAAGIGAYDPPDTAGNPSGLPGAPVDTRRFLDQLAVVSGVDLGDAFGDLALGPAAEVELVHRAGARDGYEQLLAAAGDWGAPDPIRAAMTEWRFADAAPAIAAARAWLAERDELIARIAAGGLATPDRLRQRYVIGGGGPEATAELNAERVVVDAFNEVRSRVNAPRWPIEAIGLIGTDSPESRLGEASVAFTAGELTIAAETLDALLLQLNRANSDGLLRLAALALGLGMTALAATASIRRRRGSHYTAAP
ncbi:MAG TPA: hypothetical protein VI733_00160 [Candidatus Limnocylindria bacterium]|nr:hypothetical protein [Candidatus Limnocylindria bacterium]